MLRLQPLTIGLAGAQLLLTSCTTEHHGPNMAPIGEGLRFLGVALVVAVLVAVFGITRRGGGGPHG